MSPRDTVLAFVRLVQADTLADIAPYVDIASVARYEYTGAKYDSLNQQQKESRLLQGFIGDGEYRRTWGKSQIIVNEQSFLDDTTAAVEVSFIDRSSRIQYYSQMGLRKRTAGWIIYSFKVN